MSAKKNGPASNYRADFFFNYFNSLLSADPDTFLDYFVMQESSGFCRFIFLPAICSGLNQ
jgi:hypothetical protein